MGEPNRAARDSMGWLLWLLAGINFANAAWMLWDPLLWYTDLPAGVPDFGPYNEHFVRDLGSTFLTLGVALGWAAHRRELRLPLVAVATLFYALHAGGHVFDTARGFVDPHHWWLDLPGVYLPAALMLWLTWRLWRPHEAA